MLSLFSLLYFVTLHADQLSIHCGMMSFRLNNLIAFLLSLLVATRCWKKSFLINRSLLWGIGAITFTFFLSFLFSPYKIRSFTFLAWWAVTLLFYLFLPYFLMQIITFQKLFTLYILSFLIVGGYAFLQLLLSSLSIHDPFASQFVLPEKIVRANAFCYEPSYYALYMTPFVMMSNLFYILKMKNYFPLFSPLRLGHLILINFLYVLSTSTSTFFSYFFFAFILLFALRKEASKFLLGLGIALAIPLCAFPFLAKEFFLKFFYHGFTAHHSFVERWVGICNGWMLFKIHPIVGTGMGSYPLALLDRYCCGDRRFFFLHNSASETLGKTIKNFEPSNVFIEIASSLGIMGILSFLFFILLFFLSYCKCRHASSAHEKQIALIFFLSTLVMLVTLQFNQGIFRTYIWTHIALSWAYFDTTIAASLPSQPLKIVARSEA